ncbi:MAG: hypothetical protein GWM90_28260 [Gemmatimonadetes bacterium]|nr:hypothetical protein [Gemmatimonadota bacterium]NIQ58922.1 hypothetical protein [Gemmatimonadota bacterium]NIU79107.1 hypothetical protein [Gammaproteobacteria bacterium]NIX47822.1 hypothetical protein [Gemmatimonadota bacterium]
MILSSWRRGTPRASPVELNPPAAPAVASLDPSPMNRISPVVAVVRAALDA